MPSPYPLRKRIKKFLKKLETSAPITGLIGFLIYAYACLVGLTTKWQIRGLTEVYKAWRQHRAIILIIWHGRSLLPCYFWKNKKQFPMSALVSPHRDGRLIAAVLRHFGIKVIDGSTNEHARSAALSLMRELQDNNAITISPDGPKGPNMQLGHSALYFAQKSGKPIVGMTYSVKGAKFANSWDKMLLPPLFSRGIAAATEPFLVADNLSEEQLEQQRLKIEQALNELTWQIDAELGLPKVEQGTSARAKKYPLQGQ